VSWRDEIKVIRGQIETALVQIPDEQLSGEKREAARRAVNALESCRDELEGVLCSCGD
jgi:hypothetical protein